MNLMEFFIFILQIQKILSSIIIYINFEELFFKYFISYILIEIKRINIKSKKLLFELIVNIFLYILFHACFSFSRLMQ